MKRIGFFALFAIGIVLGISLGWLLYHPRVRPLDPPAPAVRQADGSLVLERRPDPTANPASEIPRGSVLERKISVEVSPRVDPAPAKDDVFSGPNAPEVAAHDCPPVNLDLSLVRMPDDSRRVIASSENGTLVGGLDVPVAPLASTLKPYRWNVSALTGYDAPRARQVFGGSVSYSRGPFVGTAGVVGTTTFVGAGIRF